MNYHNTKHISPSAYLLLLICMVCMCVSKLHAQESCYEQYLREHNMPFLTAEDADDSYEELKKEVLARQMMRKESLFQPLLLAVDTISGACHLLAQDGSLIADVHLALVDSTWYMWLSVDPLADKYPGSTPYIYCNGNPVMYVDPDGKRPTAYEAALLAACAYENDNNVIEQKLSGTGWVKSSFPTSISMQNENNGLQSALFEKAVDGVTEYVYAFAGTQLISIEDWEANVSQLKGLSYQYSEAIQNALQLSSEVGSAELTFVGHSLGGGEAAASSMATGRAAITFNPAVVTTNTILKEGLLFSGDRITNYRAVGNNVGRIIVGGDILNNLQNNHGLYLPGRTFSVNTGWIPTHGIEVLIKYLQNER